MTTASKCRAKGGAKSCTDPNCPEKRAHAARMASFYAHPASSKRQAPTAPKAKAMARALSVELGWKGAKPSWWNAYAAEAAASPSPHEPELLDVFDSPAGKIAVVWHEESPSEHDWKLTEDSSIGLHKVLLKSVETGETFGYLKLSHVTDTSFERSFGNDEFAPFRYKERFGGGSLGLHYEEEESGVSNRNLTGQALLEQRRRTWEEARYLSSRYGILVDSNLSGDERVAAGLAALSAAIAPEVKVFRKSWVHPLVDFARIEDIDETKPNPLANRGFGSAMYVYAARKLGQTGHMLRASDTQTNEAQALWARLAKLLPTNYTELKVTTRQRRHLVYPALDFRTRKSIKRTPQPR